MQNQPQRSSSRAVSQSHGTTTDSQPIRTNWYHDHPKLYATDATEHQRQQLYNRYDSTNTWSELKKMHAFDRQPWSSQIGEIKSDRDRSSYYNRQRPDLIPSLRDFNFEENQVREMTRKSKELDISDYSIDDKIILSSQRKPNNFSSSSRRIRTHPSPHRYSSVGTSESSASEVSPSFGDWTTNDLADFLSPNKTKVTESVQYDDHRHQASHGILGSPWSAHPHSGSSDQGTPRQSVHQLGVKSSSKSRSERQARSRKVNGNQGIDSRVDSDGRTSKKFVAVSEIDPSIPSPSTTDLVVTELFYNTDDHQKNSDVAFFEDDLDDDGPEIQVNPGCYLSIQLPANRFNLDETNDGHGRGSGSGLSGGGGGAGGMSSEKKKSCGKTATAIATITRTITTLEKTMKRQESGFGFVLTFESENDEDFKNLPVFESVMEGGAAELAGIFPGDRLFEANGISASSISPFFCRKLFENVDEVIVKLIRCKTEEDANTKKATEEAERVTKGRGRPKSKSRRSKLIRQEVEQVVGVTSSLEKPRDRASRSVSTANEQRSRPRPALVDISREKHQSRSNREPVGEEQRRRTTEIETGRHSEDKTRKQRHRSSRRGGGNLGETNGRARADSLDRKTFDDKGRHRKRQEENARSKQENSNKKSRQKFHDYSFGIDIGQARTRAKVSVKRQISEGEPLMRNSAEGGNSGATRRSSGEINSKRSSESSVTKNELESSGFQEAQRIESTLKFDKGNQVRKNYRRNGNHSVDSVYSFERNGILRTEPRTSESSEIDDLSPRSCSSSTPEASRKFSVASILPAAPEHSFPADQTSCVSGNSDARHNGNVSSAFVIPLKNESQPDECDKSIQECDGQPDYQVTRAYDTVDKNEEGLQHMVLLAPPSGFSDVPSSNIPPAMKRYVKKGDTKPPTLPKPSILVGSSKTAASVVTTNLPDDCLTRTAVVDKLAKPLETPLDSDKSEPETPTQTGCGDMGFNSQLRGDKANSSQDITDFISTAEKLRQRYLDKTSDRPTTSSETHQEPQEIGNYHLKEDDSFSSEFPPAPPGFGDSCDNLDAKQEPFVTTKQIGQETCDSVISLPGNVKVTSSGGFQSSPFLSWTPGDVGDWLESQKLGEHRERFINQSIDGVRLTQLDRSSLIGLGMTNALHRMHFERALLRVQNSVFSSREPQFV